MQSLVTNIQRVIVGKDTIIRNLILALAIGRHVLVEDVPGVGKTTLIKSLAQSLNLSFRRIQFTPDLLPTDVTGTSMLESEGSRFVFRKGPIFHNIVLADEINRASPKTQASLLEAMEENQVTVDGTTYPLEYPFLVMATQNPIEYEGTFPLPEAQLDRFSMALEIGYPDHDEEKTILKRFQKGPILDTVKPIAGIREVDLIRNSVDKIFVSEPVIDYIIGIMRRTRETSDVYLGASPRASLAMLKLSQALALFEGMDYVLPDHVKEMAVPVLRHRIILTPEARWENQSSVEVIRRVLNRVTTPSPQQQRA